MALLDIPDRSMDQLVEPTAAATPSDKKCTADGAANLGRRHGKCGPGRTLWRIEAINGRPEARQRLLIRELSKVINS